MNQILDHSGPKKPKEKKNPEDTMKIIKVYAILIIVFALCFIGKGAYSLVENKKLDGQQANANKMDRPLIELNADQDLLSINISYTSAIENVTYQWYRGNVSAEEISEYEATRDTNSSSSENEADDELVEEDDTSIKALGKLKEEKGIGENTIRIENIGIPRGETTICVRVKTVDNIISEYIQPYYTDVGVDRIEPEINVVIQGNKKMIITATDETEISKLIYTINGGQEVEVSERTDKKTIREEIEFVEGRNMIKISAVDKANNTGSREIDAYSGKPTIEFTAEPDFSKIYVKVAYPGGISKIEYDFNGEKHEEEFKNMSDEYEIELDSVEGHNVIYVKVYTTEEDVFSEDTGECDYNP